MNTKQTVSRGGKRSLEEVRAASEEERLIRLGHAGKYRDLNRKKLQARRAVYVEVRAGRMIKEPCRVCHLSKSEAHHPDYDKPLQVDWLCKTHHELAHHPLNKGARAGE